MWLLEQSVRQRLSTLEAGGFTPTAEQQLQFDARGFGGDDISSTADGVANINVHGVITNKPSIMSLLFGGGNTTYSGINEALAAADADPDVSEIKMDIDSPGGTVAGFYSTVQAMRNTSKPINVHVSGQAQSAAYGIASQADNITASDPMVRIGSVGVVVDVDTDDGVKSITSSNAPNKRPDVNTDEGVATIRSELDDMEKVFVGAIAEGRKTTDKNVIKSYGQGGTFLAVEAMEIGMIDGIQSSATPKPVKTANLTKANSMNLEELKAQYPDVHAAAVAEGVNKERVRVSAHVTYGESCGVQDQALAAIKNGTELDQAVIAEYMTAGMNRADINARSEETPSADAGTAAVADEENQATRDEELEAKIHAQACEMAGIEVLI